jgi:hypothetical protein
VNFIKKPNHNQTYQHPAYTPYRRQETNQQLQPTEEQTQDYTSKSAGKFHK